MASGKFFLTAFLAWILVPPVLTSQASTIKKNRLHVVVTPGSVKGFHCKLRPEMDPPRVVNEVMKLHVEARGGVAPFKWRIPLYNKKQGINVLSVARIGYGNPGTDHAFIIDLNASDLEQEQADEINLELESRDGQQTSCRIPASGLRQIALTRPPIELNIVKGAIVR
jgi:hypothetical protein